VRTEKKSLTGNRRSLKTRLREGRARSIGWGLKEQKGASKSSRKSILIIRKLRRRTAVYSTEEDRRGEKKGRQKRRAIVKTGATKTKRVWKGDYFTPPKGQRGLRRKRRKDRRGGKVSRGGMREKRSSRTLALGEARVKVGSVEKKARR